MKSEDQYLKFVRWNEADGLYVGYWSRFISLGRSMPW